LWSDTGFVFASEVGTPLDGSNVTHRFQLLIEKYNAGKAPAGQLPRQRFHDFRHAAATFLLEVDVPARIVMEQLGHSQIALTLGRYSHVRAKLQNEAAQKPGAILSDAV
jgi:integrase